MLRIGGGCVTTRKRNPSQTHARLSGTGHRCTATQNSFTVVTRSPLARNLASLAWQCWAPTWRALRERNVKESVRGNLKPDDSYEPQLVINELALPPGGEWSPPLPGWLVIHVSSGVGYWLHPRLNWELQMGAIILLSDQAQGCVRASQVGELRLRFFRIEPGKLIGLMSLADQALLQNAARDEKLSMRVLP